MFHLCDTCKFPLYGPVGPKRPHARAGGRARQIITRPGGADWSVLHGERVVCTTRDRGIVAKIALAADERNLGGQAEGRIRGFLSVTGHSIQSKTSERLFVPKKDLTIQAEKEHHAMWHTALASYHDVAEQREPGAELAAGCGCRPMLVPTPRCRTGSREGDLVYLERDQHGTITAISPVYIGRLPYAAAPDDLLDPTPRPAASLDDLSPEDRLFAWAPPQPGTGRAAASGYRGRLRIVSVRCDTDDWRTEFPEPGITVAPLSSRRSIPRMAGPPRGCPVQTSSHLGVLASDFEQQAKSSPVLAPAIAAGLPEPAAYPRTGSAPEAETYRWFVANEKIKRRKPEHGYALPHILEQDQRLPHLSPDEARPLAVSAAHSRRLAPSSNTPQGVTLFRTISRARSAMGAAILE